MAQGSAPTARVVRVLEALRLHAGAGLRYAELAHDADVSQATCHAILATLADAGYVVRDPSTKAYSLGPALLGLGDAAARAFPEVRLAHAELDALATETGLRCHAAKVVDDAITVVAVAGAAAVDDPIRPWYPRALRPAIRCDPRRVVERSRCRAVDPSSTELGVHRGATARSRRRSPPHSVRGGAVHARVGPVA